MTPHQILALCSRLAALIWGLYTLSSMPRYFIRLDHPPVDNRATVLTLVGVQIAACVFLWLFSTTVAQKLLPLKEDVIAAPSRVVDWQILGVVCVGLWGLIRAIPDAMYWTIILQTWLTADYGLTALTIAQKARIASTILELGLALWLVFGARRVSTYLFGARITRARD
ncbi:MAG TPA: hypothetical protein VNZ53_07800 [Steroidobacteraceae bacterium]|nr:hypothetical protein [Steroidobacteraceae bacterium]